MVCFFENDVWSAGVSVCHRADMHQSVSLFGLYLCLFSPLLRDVGTVCFCECESASLSNACMQRPYINNGKYEHIHKCSSGSLVRPNKQGHGSGPHKDHFVSALVPQTWLPTEVQGNGNERLEKELRVQQNGGGSTQRPSMTLFDNNKIGVYLQVIQ